MRKRHGSIFPYSQPSPVSTVALTLDAPRCLQHWLGLGVLGRKVQPAGDPARPRRCVCVGGGTLRMVLTGQWPSLTTEPTDHPEAVTGGLGRQCLSLLG